MVGGGGAVAVGTPAALDAAPFTQSMKTLSDYSQGDFIWLFVLLAAVVDMIHCSNSPHGGSVSKRGVELLTSASGVHQQWKVEDGI